MWWIAGGALAAAPVFEGSVEDVALAVELWPAAVACAGWEPQTADTIPIRRGDAFPAGSAFAAGLAFSGPEGLREIMLVEHASPVVLAHEISHAWFSGGPMAFAEGRAELMSACIAERLPHRVRFARSDDYIAQHLPDLRTLKRSAFVDLSPRELNAAYTGAWRLFAIVGAIVPRERVFDKGLRTWSDLEALLASAGDGGRLVSQALEGGAETQRRAFDDPDMDGLENLLERVLGLDPDRWDTDGDGWWDGAPTKRHPGAVPLSRDGTPACLPRVAAGDLTQVVFGGNLRGTDLGELTVMAARNVRLQMATDQFAHRGGYYAAPTGANLQPNPHCTWAKRSTVLVNGDRGIEGLQRVSDALEKALDRFGALLGPAPHRLLLVANPDADTLRSAEVFGRKVTEVRIPTSLLQRALRDDGQACQTGEFALRKSAAARLWWLAKSKGRRFGCDDSLVTVVYHAAAVHHLSGAALANRNAPALAAALREHILDAKGPIYGDAFRGEVNRWHRAAKACGSWPALLDDDCPGPQR